MNQNRTTRDFILKHLARLGSEAAVKFLFPVNGQLNNKS